MPTIKPQSETIIYKGYIDAQPNWTGTTSLETTFTGTDLVLDGQYDLGVNIIARSGDNIRYRNTKSLITNLPLPSLRYTYTDAMAVTYRDWDGRTFGAGTVKVGVFMMPDSYGYAKGDFTLSIRKVKDDGAIPLDAGELVTAAVRREDLTIEGALTSNNSIDRARFTVDRPEKISISMVMDSNSKHLFNPSVELVNLDANRTVRGTTVAGVTTYTLAPGSYMLSSTGSYIKDDPLVEYTTTIKLLADLSDDVVFVDGNGKVTTWQLANGRITKVTEAGQAGPEWAVQEVGDFNGDGAKDLLWRDTAGHINTWSMHGGTTVAAPNIGKVGAEWSIQGSGDFDGNGSSDILWRDQAGHVNVWTMNKDAQLVSAPNIGMIGAEWTVQGVGDFNGDGRADILWRDDAGHVNTWMTKDSRVESAPNIGTIDARWLIQGVGDFNGDGRDDILWRDDAGNVNLWLMDARGQVASAPNIGRISADWTVQGIGDFDGNGSDDILWRDTAGHVNTWNMNNGRVGTAPNLGVVDAGFRIVD